MIERLIETVRMLAAPFEVQRRRYPDFPAAVRDLAFDYADAFTLVCDCPQIRLTPNQKRILQDLDDLLLSLHSANVTHLQSNDWQEVRAAAARALDALGEPYEAPCS